MTVIVGNATIECTPEEFKRLIELGVIKNNYKDLINNFGVQSTDNKDFPPYLDLPKKWLIKKMQRIIVTANTEDLKGVDGLAKMVKLKVERDKMFCKLRELVKEQKSFEEESLQYTYKGDDKEDIWSCMEFFYANLWTKEFREFIWSDNKDDWENYNIQLKLKDKYSLVTIVYGIGAFCVIAPTTYDSSKPVLDLEKIVVKTTSEIIYND